MIFFLEGYLRKQNRFRVISKTPPKNDSVCSVTKFWHPKKHTEWKNQNYPTTFQLQLVAFWAQINCVTAATCSLLQNSTLSGIFFQVRSALRHGGAGVRGAGSGSGGGCAAGIAVRAGLRCRCHDICRRWWHYPWGERVVSTFWFELFIDEILDRRKWRF